MQYFNLHTHTSFSDGSDKPEMYIKEAIRQNFSTLGFTDHSPVPFSNSFALREERLDVYCNDILNLKRKYSSMPGKEIDIFLGMEIDFIPGVTTLIGDYRKKYSFDYLIGSVHLVKNTSSSAFWFIDGPEMSIYEAGLLEIFNGNARNAVTAYYRQIQEMVTAHKPDIVGHLDKVKMYNRDRYFSEVDHWYEALIDETLDLVKNAGCVIEVNTRGLYKQHSDSLFPGIAVLKKILKRKIPITLCSDTHKPHELSLLFPETITILRAVGFRFLTNRTKTGWMEVSLSG